MNKVLIDYGSSVDMIFRHALKRMILNGPLKKQNYVDIQGPLYGFGNNDMPTTIDLLTTSGTELRKLTTLVKYYIIDIAFP